MIASEAVKGVSETFGGVHHGTLRKICLARLTQSRILVSLLNMTKQDALNLFGNNGAELARALNITRSAVSLWRDDQIPKEHELMLRFVIKPEAFKADGQPSEAA